MILKPLARWLRALADRLDATPAVLPPAAAYHGPVVRTVKPTPDRAFAAPPRIVPDGEIPRPERRRSERAYDFGRPIEPPRPAPESARHASISPSAMSAPPPDAADFLVPFVAANFATQAKAAKPAPPDSRSSSGGQ